MKNFSELPVALLVNCGGPGSGKPGPCPLVQTKTAKGWSATLAPMGGAKKVAEDLISHLKNVLNGDPTSFRDIWSKIEDKDKKAVHKELKKLGALHVIDARRTGVMTASEVISSIRSKARA